MKTRHEIEHLLEEYNITDPLKLFLKLTKDCCSMILKNKMYNQNLFKLISTKYKHQKDSFIEGLFYYFVANELTSQPREIIFKIEKKRFTVDTYFTGKIDTLKLWKLEHIYSSFIAFIQNVLKYQKLRNELRIEMNLQSLSDEGKNDILMFVEDYVSSLEFDQDILKEELKLDRYQKTLNEVKFLKISWHALKPYYRKMIEDYDCYKKNGKESISKLVRAICKIARLGKKQESGIRKSLDNYIKNHIIT
jgi:hypothetical protein